MRFKSLFLALLATIIGLVFATPFQAQMRNDRRADVKRVAQAQKAIRGAGVVPLTSNYQVTQTTGAITPGTTAVTGFNCGSTPPGDDCTAPVTLPFDVMLYDQTFPAATAMNVSSNGNLQFVSNSPDYGQGDVCFPITHFNYAILPHWGDLTIGGANEGIFTSISGSAPNRIFNIEWRASLLGNTPGSLNFEVRLYEGVARFDIIFGTATSGRDVTVGVQRSTGSTYTEFSCHQSSLRNGMMLIFNGNAETSLYIAGRVTDSDGNPVAGATVNLTGNSTGSVVTDGTGDYVFAGLSSGGTYSVAATQAGFGFFPQIRNFGSGNRAFTGNFIVNFIRTTPPNPGDIVISEFRFRGEDPFSTVSEFVEIANNTNQGITVNVTGSPGWLVRTADPAINFTIPNGTTIPARGHYLAGNGSGYSLFAYASADTFYSGDIPDFTGIAILSGADRLDAVGFTGEPDPLFREGAGLISPGANAGNYSFVRKLTSGVAQDTNDNAADFQFVSIDGGIYGGVQSTLGAPGPENTTSPIQRNAQVKASLIDPTAGSSNSPNRVRNVAPYIDTLTPSAPNGGNPALNPYPGGTLTIRRKFTNSTGVPVTRLRFRIVDITTFGNIVAGQADLRALTSPSGIITVTGGGTAQVRGLTVEQAGLPQPRGGGMDTSLAVGVITVSQPLAPGASVNVEFLLGVQTGGSFRFFVNVEALP